MDGYGKPGYTREEFQREMDDELNAVSSLDREYQQTLEGLGNVLNVEAGLSEILNAEK
jgi:hypothetical protein